MTIAASPWSDSAIGLRQLFYPGCDEKRGGTNDTSRCLVRAVAEAAPASSRHSSAQPKPVRPGARDLALVPISLDDRLPLLIALNTARDGPVDRRRSGATRRASAVLGQHPTDRPDTPTRTSVGAVLVVADERNYLVRGRSSSAATSDDAALRISFARRSSAFCSSDNRRLISATASVVTPAVAPASTRPRRPKFGSIPRSNSEHLRDRDHGQLLPQCSRGACWDIP